MSIKLMSMVWDRYQATGGELLLALALADHAHDSGKSIYAGVDTLAAKTRQSVRTVQYQLRRMQELGWLVKIGHGNGGRSRHVTYHINAEWIKGAEAAPFATNAGGVPAPDDVVDDGAPYAVEEGPSEVQDSSPDGAPESASGEGSELLENESKGAATVAPFSKTERVQPEVQKGAIAVAPVNKTRLTVLLPHTPSRGGSDPDGGSGGKNPPVDAVSPPSGKRRRSRSPIGLKAYIDVCRQDGVKPVPEGCSVFNYADTVGIPRDLLALHWAEFRDRHLRNEKRQKDWIGTLLNSVKGNWYGFWAMQAGGGFVLTTKGLQAQAWHQSQRAEP